MFQKKPRKNLRMLFVVAFALVFSASWSVGALFAAAPTVTTGTVVNIEKTSATLIGSVTDTDDQIITEVGFEYGLTTSYGSTVTGDPTHEFNSVFVGSPGTGQSEFASGGSSPSGIAIDSNGDFYVADRGNNRIQKFDSSGGFIREFGTTGSAESQFSTAAAVEVDSNDDVYVADQGNRRIQKFDSDGNFIFAIGYGVDDGTDTFQICTSTCQAGLSGTGNGQFMGASDIAVDSSDNFYVSDFTRSKVQKFDSSGAFQAIYGVSGLSAGEISTPRGIAIDSNGNFFITDFPNGNPRIQKFDSAFNYISGGASGSSFSYYGIDLSSDENIYIATQGLSFFGFVSLSNTLGSTGGSALLSLGGNGSIGIALDPLDNLYITDGTNSQIQKFTRTRIALNVEDLNCGTTYHYRAFATNTDGTSYSPDATFDTSACDLPVLETKSALPTTQTSGFLTGLQTSDGVSASTERGFQYGTTTSYGTTAVAVSDSLSLSSLGFGFQFTSEGAFDTPAGIAQDGAGNIYVADTNNNRIQKFDSAGTFVSMFGWGVATGASNLETCTSSCLVGLAGTGDGQLDAPRGLDIDSATGDIYVADTGNSRVQKFDSTGGFLEIFGGNGTPGSGPGEFDTPVDIAVFRSSGTVFMYVVDSGDTLGTDRVQKIDSSGTMLAETDAGELSDPQGIALTTDYLLYVTDSGNNRIVVLDSSLGLSTVNFSVPSGWTDISNPVGIAVNSKGGLYITDSGNSRVVYATRTNSTSYNYVASYGSVGSSLGQFDAPAGILVDNTDDARIYVAEETNHRVQALSPFFSKQVKPLSCGTTYHYRVYATNADGTGYGSDQTFRTLDCGNPTTTTDPGPPEGCMDSLASNYDPDAEEDDGSCIFYGCTDIFADNFNSAATDDDGTCTYTTPGPGCMNPLATNYNPFATSDNGSCVLPGGGEDDPPTDPVPGCTDVFADNYNPDATVDDGVSCEYSIDPTDGPGISGCTNPSATNYNSSATTNDGSCIFPPDEPPIITTIVDVVENITGMDRDEQIKTYKDVATLGIAAPAVLYALTQRAALASLLLRLWNIIPTLLGFRRKRRPWGTVFDSVTKQPLDPVYVTLRDKEGAEVSTSITDMDGRYGFVTDVGSYVLDAKKGDYIFPSTKLKGQDSDELYEHLYFGEQIDVDTADSIINKNIPMDAVNFNWNEFEKAKNKKLMKFFSQGELFLARIARVIFFAGLVASIMLALLEPYFWNYAILGLYILIIVLMLCGVKPRQPGFVVERSTGYPLSFAILSVYSALLNKEVAHTIVGKTGKYHVLVPKGRYYLKLQKKTGEQTYEDIYTSESFKVRKGYIDKVIKI